MLDRFNRNINYLRISVTDRCNLRCRLTWGEPLVRREMEKLVVMISAVHGLEEVCMTKNGLRLKDLASRLKTAGLSRINISFDSFETGVQRKPRSWSHCRTRLMHAIGG